MAIHIHKVNRDGEIWWGRFQGQMEGTPNFQGIAKNIKIKKLLGFEYAKASKQNY